MNLIKYLIFLLSFNAMAVTFPVNTPTERADDTPLGLSEINGYNVYCGSAANTVKYYSAGAQLPQSTINIAVPSGVHNCVITTLDIDGRESSYSLPFVININIKANPKPPAIPPGFEVKEVK